MKLGQDATVQLDFGVVIRVVFSKATVVELSIIIFTSFLGLEVLFTFRLPPFNVRSLPG